MSIPHIFAPVLPQDFTLNPIQVHKKFILVRNGDFYTGSVPITGSGYKVLEARYLGEKMKLGSSTYPTNSFDGSYQHIIWNSIDAQYYRFPYDTFSTFEHSNPRFTYKFLNYSASVISIPQGDFGESIKPGSVEITGSGFMLRDDKNGNLYDSGIDTGSFPPTKNLVAHWGFDTEFRKTKFENPYWIIGNKSVSYSSKIFTPDDESFCKNVKLSSRTDIGSTSGSGLFAYLESASILTNNRQEFNFSKNDDFTIAFWLESMDNSDHTSSLITKRGVVRKSTYGNQLKHNQNDLLINSTFVSSSYINQYTNVFPYDIELAGTSSLIFKRSDGINQVALIAQVDNLRWNHVAVVKSGSLYSIYKNGAVAATSSNSSLGNCVNNHCILFGSSNLSFNNSSLTSIDEIRMYNTGLTTAQIATLATSSSVSMYQTAVVGNVFYRNGMIVVGGLDIGYSTIINSDFTLKFRSTHTIYQYETLIRIKKGSFNLSQNPTARQNPYTDLILNDMTASLDQGGLFPYATSIGLYNDSGELMAVAKLNQPLAMRDDVDISLLIRWDS